MTWDLLLTDCRAATMDGAGYGAIEDAAIAISGDHIAWIGPRGELPKRQAKETVSLGGRWVTPGLVECHTHLVFGGDRAHEFELRLGGASYEDIAKAGGGIVSTVKATRAASEVELLASARKRLDRLMAEGVTMVEIKSGYGLDVENELKQLRVARALEEAGGITIRTTCLAAHALPPEYAGRPGDYIDLVCNEILPAVAAEGLADAVDAFSERIAFTAAQTELVFNKAKRLALPVKLHADQLSDMGGAALAARYGALSADHIEYSSAAGIAAMGTSGTVAVVLPGAFYFLREKQVPPIDLLRQNKVRIAISTDCNPGSSPMLSLLTMMNMACTLFRMTPEES
ncbi:MAG TPA: imidazolonepropionase, partial [Dongiaceae bacterium]|nr:imidazolonepropionase [Dongiaceae bacterium]